jgi:hypothetical protein
MSGSPDYFQRCAEIKRSNRKHVSSIYTEFCQMRFQELLHNYESDYRRNKEQTEQLLHQRAELVTYGCFVFLEEIEKNIKNEDQKERLDRLADFAQELGEEKTNKKVALLNFIGELRKINHFHRELLEAENAGSE